MTEFDAAQFAALLDQAKGNRSINQYARESGVTSAHISRLSRGLLSTPPSPQIIRKLADSAYNGITYEALMAAAGHVDVPTEAPAWATSKDKRDFKKMLLEDGDLMFDGMPIDSEGRQRIMDVLTGLFWEAKQMNKRKKTDSSD